MPLLISDANIFIDLEDGGLIDVTFKLPEQIGVPDILYADELEKHHPQLPSLGLQIRTLNPAGIRDLMQLNAAYGAVSRYDCAALALARQLGCTLLTGDAHLRAAAEAENVPVHGTIWLVERMIEERLVDIALAGASFEKMRLSGRRLPWHLVEEMLRRWV